MAGFTPLMFSYRHAFHAGNHADILKHLVLREVLLYLNNKPKPWSYVDTHAGAGRYDLRGSMASKGREAEWGIERLLGREDLPEALVDLVAAVGQGSEYLGSPQLAADLARSSDRLWLYEKHPTDFKALRGLFAGDRRVRCGQSDGFAGLRAQWPPASRRGLALIDPSYELLEDYKAVVKVVGDGLERFATGVMAIWFPLLPSPESQRLAGKLQQACSKPWLLATLQVRLAPKSGLGMYGSGMFVVNPPYTLAATLGEALPVLERLLSIGSGAMYTLLEGEGVA